MVELLENLEYKYCTLLDELAAYFSNQQLSILYKMDLVLNRAVP